MLLVSVLINFLAIVFTFTMGRLVLDDSTEVSESTCDVVYLVCTIFWPIVKSLVHIYFNEKVNKNPPIHTQAYQEAHEI
jgi:hypothetical protein